VATLDPCLDWPAMKVRVERITGGFFPDCLHVCAVDDNGVRHFFDVPDGCIVTEGQRLDLSGLPAEPCSQRSLSTAHVCASTIPGTAGMPASGPF
jgi:hypothetical protein